MREDYQTVPYRLYVGRNGEVVHFNEVSLTLTTLPELHRKVLAEFSDCRSKESVIARFASDAEIISVIDELVDLGLLTEDCSALLSPEETSFHPNARAFRVVLTERCNLRCAECFVTKNSINPRTMSKGKLREAIRRTVPYGTKECATYHFFGGEPLLRFDLIQEAVNILEDAVLSGRCVRPSYAITTNATLVTDEIISFFRGHNFKVGISIDGIEDTHDRFRAYADGSSSFKTVARNYDCLAACGVDVHALVTPHPDILDALPGLFQEILERFPMKTITVNTPFRFDTVQWNVPGERYASILMDLSRIANEFGVTVDSATSVPLAAIAGGVHRRSPCAFRSDSIMASISPDGRMSHCPQKWRATDSAKVGDTLVVPVNRTQSCLSCEARGICGGPCPAFQRLSGEMLDKNRCDFMKALLGEFVRNLDLFEFSE